MRISSSKLKKSSTNILTIFIITLSISGCIFSQNVVYVQALIYNGIKQSQIDYDYKVELEYSIPIQISEVSVPPANIFGGQFIIGLYLKANFSNNNGSIWINAQNNETIWKDYLNVIIEETVDVNTTSIRKYSLWANSSTLGNNTLYFTFLAIKGHAENFALGITLVLLPIIIISSVCYGIKYVKKKEPRSVRFAKRISERMAIKYEDKYQEKVTKVFGDKFKLKGKNLCPKCGVEIKNKQAKFCTGCGFKLLE